MSLWRPFPFKPPHGPSSMGSYRFCPQNILHTYSSLPSPTPAGFFCEPTGQARQRSKLASKTQGRGRGMVVFFFLSPLHHVHFSRLKVTSIADYLLWPLLNSAPMPRALSRSGGIHYLPLTCGTLGNSFLVKSHSLLSDHNA